ncbi:MAG: hypothetical protein HOC24_06625 [Deltaproteobacteria bacterium]|jgi:sarcosine oxidase, subunit beta|nr:hypothetical protein [Deltaproteobacteria bacterium]
MSETYDAIVIGAGVTGLAIAIELRKNGPVVGQIVAEIIDAVEKGHNHDEEAVQVKLRNIDFTLNTRIFSRNRDIIKNSTFSVLG